MLGAAIALAATSACASREVPVLGDAEVCSPSTLVDLVKVVDGDTVDVRRDDTGYVERIRLLGLQAGEIFKDDGEQSCSSQDDGECCYGDIASLWLEDVLSAVDEITLGFDLDCTGLYGRTLGYLWVPDESDPTGEEHWFVNREALRLGVARYYDTEVGDAQDIRFRDDFVAVEAEASAAGRGLWQVCEG